MDHFTIDSDDEIEPEVTPEDESGDTDEEVDTMFDFDDGMVGYNVCSYLYKSNPNTLCC